MKNFTKLLAVLLCAVIALSTAACSIAPQHSYKVAGTDEELPMGVYIYAMYNAYNQAEAYAQQTKAFDSATGLYNGEESFLGIEITDDDGKKAIAEDWIKAEAERKVKEMVAVEKEFKRLGATIDQASYDSSAKSLWDNGLAGMYDANTLNQIAQMYGEETVMPKKDIFEPYGISLESYKRMDIVALKKQAIFDKLYLKGGEKAVSDDDFTKYFEENYTSYTYFSESLSTTDEVQQSEGGTLSNKKALSKEEIAKHEKTFKGYVSDIKNGKSIDDVKKAHMTDYKLSQDTATTSVENLKNSAIGEDLVKAITDLKDGEASYKIIGEEENQTIYFFYKEPIKKQTSIYLANTDNYNTVIADMKQGDFDSYVKKLVDAVKLEKSRFVDKHDPSMFEEEKE